MYRIFQAWRWWGRSISPLEILAWPGWLFNLWVQFEAIDKTAEVEEYPWADPEDEITPLPGADYGKLLGQSP